MGAKNEVIAGDYEKKKVMVTAKGAIIVLGFTTRVYLDKTTIEEYEVMDESHTTSAVSAVGRGLVGSFLLGPVGLLVGLSAKKKGTHVLAVKFKDGKKSMIEVDEKIYKKIMTVMF
ncbi:hypothetical protein ACFOLF_20945 [Paenibacillus sepulcri]|uniref:Uncharacterized protein n=1 Tax=Paenibacillus sepulcri TaxID=359917 RepID=A0ABS7BW62_9BACL|nr:hypothetical protein [Paenibacillus sepulcri]